MKNIIAISVAQFFLIMAMLSLYGAAFAPVIDSQGSLKWDGPNREQIFISMIPIVIIMILQILVIRIAIGYGANQSLKGSA